MSKSLGNSVDPVEMIEKHGADALRFSFLAHLYSGKDFKFSEQRLEGYRNFMNKIWNAARFVLSNLQDFKAPAEGVKALPKKSSLSTYDQWIIFKLGEVEKKVEAALESDHFREAAQALYQCVWNQFCEWDIEFTKPILQGPKTEERETTQLVLAQVLNRIVRLLHPFTPFITEEIYHKLPIKGTACITDEYPTERKDREFLAFGNEAAATEVEVVKEVIAGIRNIRGENRISPAQTIAVRLDVVDDKAQKILSANKSSITTLGKVSQLDIGTEGNMMKCAVAPIAVKDITVKVVIPLEGLVDFAEEIKRIQKTIEKLNKDVSMLTAKLSNEKFVKNADEDVVAADRELLENAKVQLVQLQAALVRFQ